MTDRRSMIIGAASAAAFGGANSTAQAASASTAGGSAPDWGRIAAQYAKPRGIIQLENGYWGVMAKPVLAAYQANVERVNRDSSFFARGAMAKDMAMVQQRVASALGVDDREIAFTRNATEALKGLIGGYLPLKPGDAVLIADLDYGSIQASMRTLAERRGARLISIALPEPASHDNIIEAYRAAFDANPAIKLALMTHISHRTGLLTPVRAVADLARARGIDFILDAAHAWGQIDFTLPELGVDFIGLNLHKWIGAPLGVGAMYIAKSRIGAIDHDIADEDRNPASIASRVHVGTVDWAALLTVPDALDFHFGIGAKAIEARLRHLRNRWTEPLRALPEIEILTPADPRMHGGITSFRLRGRTTSAQNQALVQNLLDRFGIFTVHRPGIARGAAVRVTPGIFTTEQEVDALVAALRILAPELVGS